MYKNKKILAIVPARSGSKGIKDKNIQLLVEKPLLAYSIEAAIKSNVCDRIIVSTDSKRYADISRSFGAEVPFLRQDNLSTDVAGTWSVIKDVIKNLMCIGEIYDFVIVLQPTSPLREPVDILQALETMEEKDANTVVSVCESEYSLDNINYLSDNGSMEMFYSKNDTGINHLPRQLMKKAYRINGAVFITKCNFLMSNEDVYSEKCFSYIMPRERSIDIDYPIDILIAEAILNQDNRKL